MKDNGGSAFPSGTDVGFVPGMTMRQFYKGMALAGMCAASDRRGPFRDYAHDAAAFADVLIAEDKEAGR